ncbi:MAG: DUF2321 domain-containing protein [Hyphomicrobiales bacterium]
MAEEVRHGVGKCANNHLGSYGYPTRPEDPYKFCPQCGNAMVWACGACQAPVPDDPDELKVARFCRECGAGYFGEVAPTAN